jgi:2-iminoacetate synthase ThiH
MLAIEQLATPKTLSEIKSILQLVLQRPKEGTDFLETLVERGVAVRVNGHKPTSRQVFYTETTDFQEDRLHAPIAMELELTLKCARRCSYCAYESSPEVDVQGQLVREDYSSIFKQGNEAAVFYLRLPGAIR